MPESPSRPLPVTITPGMSVVAIEGSPLATIAGMTQEYCIYRIEPTDTLAVARWREVALCDVCPAEPLLSTDVIQRDRGNAEAAVLRELLNLQQFNLSPTQQATLEELVAQLCGSSSSR